jgi:hypothetical protein
MKKITIKISFLFFAVLAFPNIYAQNDVLDVVFVPCQEMPNIIVQHDADFKSLTIAYIVESSPERNRRFQELSKHYLDRLKDIDFTSLPLECKADYILFKRDLEESIRSLEVQDSEYKKLVEWFPFAEKVFGYEKIRRKGGELDAKELALELHEMTKEIEGLQGKLKKAEDLTIPSIYTAGSVIGDLRKALESVYEFYNGYDPLFTWWVPMPYEELDAALLEYSEEFQDKLQSPGFKMDDSGIVGKPVGRDELIRALRYNMIPYSPEELIEIAEKELAWSQKQILQASREMGHGENWKAASEEVKEAYVEPGKQPQVIMRLFEESMNFIKKHDLLTIPPLAEEAWGLKMMSPERQLVNPFFTGGTSISISYPTNTMEIDDRMMSMRGNNPHFSRATVHHESIGGHHFQRYMNNRSRTYRDFGTPFWHEGNALYWEFLLYDMGFPESPEDKIGMLFWRMHRSARVIFSLNFHLGNWTPQESIDFLVDRVNFERANAEAEVRRSFTTHYSPLYQLAYMMGGLQFWALKEEVVDQGNMSLKEYHDSILELNAMPVEMVRAILTKQNLEKDFKTSWEFYKDIEKRL